MTALDLPWPQLQHDLRAFIGRRVRNEADVDDLVQRASLRIMTRVESLRETERLHAWVYQIARHVIVDHYRSAVVRREVAGIDPVDLPAASGDARIEFSALATCLPPMLDQLSPPYREAIRMTELEGLTQTDAAERAGVSVSGMKSRVQRARQQLRALVERCCRVQLDRRHMITSFEPRRAESCRCGG